MQSAWYYEQNESVCIKTAEFGLVSSSLMLTKVLTEPQGKNE